MLYNYIVTYGEVELVHWSFVSAGRLEGQPQKWITLKGQSIKSCHLMHKRPSCKNKFPLFCNMPPTLSGCTLCSKGQSWHMTRAGFPFLGHAFYTLTLHWDFALLTNHWRGGGSIKTCDIFSIPFPISRLSRMSSPNARMMSRQCAVGSSITR